MVAAPVTDENDSGDERARAIADALHAAREEDPWPDQLQLYDALTELQRWLRDDRQWAADKGGWRSLLADLRAALQAFGPDVQKRAAASTVLAELDVCHGMLGERDEQDDPALRRRLELLAEAVERAFEPTEVLAAAWGGPQTPMGRRG